MPDLKQMATVADPGDALKKMDGTYKDNAPSENDMASRLPLAAVPQGTDPKPFTIKGGS